MPIVIIVEKENIKEIQIDNILELYKKCKYKKIEGFNEINEWKIDNEKKIKLFGKVTGKNTSKNSYIFPNICTVIYGTCALVCLKNDEYIDLYIREWEKFRKDVTDLKNNTTLEFEIEEKKKKEEIIFNNKISKNNIDSDDEKEDKEDKEDKEINDDNNDNNDIDDDNYIDDDISCDEDNYNKEISDTELEDTNEINEINDDENYFSGSELSADMYIYSSDED